MNIIGISGRRSDLSSAGAGKDEVAKILVANHGFVIVSFADEIKRTAMRWYDFTPEQLWGSRKEEPDLRYPREHGPWNNVLYSEDAVCACCGVRAKQEVQCYLIPRFILRFLGTEAGRMFFFDTWVNLTLKIAKTLLEQDNSAPVLYGYTPEKGLVEWVGVLPKGVVIPDVRWPAENEGRAVKDAGGQLWLVERPGTSQTGAATAKHASETQPIPDEVFNDILPNVGTLEDLEMLVDCVMRNS